MTPTSTGGICPSMSDKKAQGPTLDKVVKRDDPRFAHLIGNPKITFEAEALANHWNDIAKILLPHGASTGLVRVYCFDGELDDQIRLENVLLLASRQDRMLVIAGQRIDGQDTVREMAQVVRRTLVADVTPEGTVVGWPYLQILPGGPLLIKTLEDRQATAGCVDLLAQAVGRESFVFHNNTSATFLGAVLSDTHLQTQVKAVTFTCGIATPPGMVLMGANAAWNLEAFDRCISMCNDFKIPFVSLHGTLSGYSRTTLPELEGWADVMLLPVGSIEEKVLYRNTVGFSLAIVLSWLATTFAKAAKKDRSAVLAVLAPWLGKDGALSQANKELFSEEWLAFMDENLTEEDFGQRDLDGIHRRFRSVAINLSFPYSNTIGDLSGCVADMPLTEEDVIAVPLRLGKKDGSRSAILGAPDSSHYAVVWAHEARTLNQAWSTIKTARLARPIENGFMPVDDSVKQGWRKYAELAEMLLNEIWKGRDTFPEESLMWLAEAKENLKNGPWAKYCRVD